MADARAATSTMVSIEWPGRLLGANILPPDACSAGGGNCTVVELALNNGISAADVSLVSPYVLRVSAIIMRQF